MEINISEEEQRQCFIEQWNNPNVLLVCEVPVFCRSVDLVTYDKKEKILTSIEFKTKNWKKAIEQVMSTAIAFDYLEICIRKPKTEISQQKIVQCCLDIGIGLYFFDIEKRKFEHRWRKNNESIPGNEEEAGLRHDAPADDRRNGGL